MHSEEVESAAETIVMMSKLTGLESGRLQRHGRHPLDELSIRGRETVSLNRLSRDVGDTKGKDEDDGHPSRTKVCIPKLHVLTHTIIDRDNYYGQYRYEYLVQIRDDRRPSDAVWVRQEDLPSPLPVWKYWIDAKKRG